MVIIFGLFRDIAVFAVIGI